MVFAVADAQDNVRPELDRFGLTEKIGEDHIFPTVEDASRHSRARVRRISAFLPPRIASA